MDKCTDLNAGALPPAPPLWRCYGGWQSLQAKAHVREPQDRPVDCVVILLHGLSQNGAGMMLKNRAAIREQLPGAAIIAPDGIYGADPDQHLRARKYRARDKSFTWFELPQGRYRPQRELRDQIAPSVLKVHELMDAAIQRYGIDESRIYLVGFSQGGAIAMQAAIERHKPCAGVANLCGPFFDPVIFGMKEPNSRPPVFYGIDLGDEVTPAGLAYHAMTSMKRLKLPVTAHITDAGPAVEMTYYDSLGTPYKAMTPQPGAPRIIEHYKTSRDDHGDITQRLVSVERTGHWVNNSMRAALIGTFKQMQEKPDCTPQGFGTEQLAERLTPRITSGRVALYWMFNPKRLSSRLPIEQRPMNSWNDLVWRGKQILGNAFNSLAQQAVTIASPLLFDVAEQVAVEVNDRRHISQIFTSLARGIARVLIPKLFDLPPAMAEHLETSLRRKETYINAGDVDALMGTPKKPGRLKSLFSRDNKPD